MKKKRPQSTSRLGNTPKEMVDTKSEIDTKSIAAAAALTALAGATATASAASAASAVTAVATTTAATATVPVASAASVPAGPKGPVAAASFPPLSAPKTITITFAPNWSQLDMQSPSRPLTVSVVFGPPGTFPQHSQFCIELLMFCDDSNAPTQTYPLGGDSFSISKADRALLWYANAPFPRFEHAVVRSGCCLSTADLRTVSVTLRTHPDEKLPHALVYVKRSAKHPINQPDNTGYIRVIRGHHYHLNITFAAGSTIAQRVGNHAWKPLIYLTTKKVHPLTGKDTVLGSRVFTHFNTNWAQGVEHNPEKWERKAAEEAIVADARAAEALRKRKAAEEATAADARAAEALRKRKAAEEATAADARAAEALRKRKAAEEATAADARAAEALRLQQSAALQYQQLEQQRALLQLTVIGQQKAQAFQHAMSPIGGTHNAKVAPATAAAAALIAGQPLIERESPPVETLADLEKEIILKPLHMIKLPRIFESASAKRFEAEKSEKDRKDSQESLVADDLIRFPLANGMSFNPSVNNFSQASILSRAMGDVEFEARMFSLDSRHAVYDAACHLLSTFSEINQLSGWQHVAWYIRNPALYLEKTKEAQRVAEAGKTYSFAEAYAASQTNMEEYVRRGQNLIKRFACRIEWLLSLLKPVNKKFDSVFALRVMAADKVWAQDANEFMREVERKVTDLVVANENKFQAFRELQRKGVLWPHSMELRKQIESAGFAFHPMMIKRDRCICKTCDVEVSGWRSWHNPWSFHNYSRHDDSFRPPANWLRVDPPATAASTATAATAASVPAVSTAAAGSHLTAAAIQASSGDYKAQPTAASGTTATSAPMRP